MIQTIFTNTLFKNFILYRNLDTLAKLKIKHPISFEKEVNKLPDSYLYMDEINELSTELCQLEK